MSPRVTVILRYKPDTYDGSVPLREFFLQFSLMARANRWSEETKAIALASSLRKKTRSVLKTIENAQNLNLVELKSRL